MKKNIKNLIFSLISTILLMIYFNTRYDFLISSTFLIFLYFFVKSDKDYDLRTKKYSIIFSIIISVILSVGFIVGNYIWDVPFNVFKIQTIVKTSILYFGFYILLYRLFNLSLSNIKKIKIFENQNEINSKQFILMWGIIILSWIPYLLRYFPARMTPDSFYVIHYANEGILSDLHTFGHTWFFGIFFHLGKLITSNLNLSVAFGTIAQMLLLSLIFSTVIKFLYKKGLNKYICLFILIFYALSPLNAVYSVTLWRDVLFGGSFSIVCLYLLDYVNNNYKLSISKIIILILTTLLMLFFRNNGIYVFILSIPLILITCKKNRVITSIIGVSIIIFYFVIKGPIFNYFNVSQTKSIEAYSIPLQQIARVIYLDGNINDKELKYLKSIIEVDKVKENYRQVISDPIKNISNGDNISDNKFKFLKNWFTILLKNPRIYIESYLFQTVGYWYPSIDYGDAGTSGKSFFENDVYNDPITGSTINNLLDSITSKRIPLSNFIWSIGTYFIMGILSLAMMLYNNKKQYLIVYIPIICLWGTIMISTPVFAELRYIYGLFTAMPILLCTPFIKEIKKTDKKRTI